MLAIFSNWLAQAPLWLIALVLFGLMVAASVIGAALRRRRARRAALEEKPEGSSDGESGLVISSVIGLLALLIAFTFSIVVDRFDTRRRNVLDEANTIGTTYLRAQLLEEPHRARISRLLIQYTDNRLVLATKMPGPEQRALLATSDRLLVDIWTATVAAYPSFRASPFAHSFLETMNQMIDMDATRKAGRQARVPAEVFVVLILYLLVATGVINYGLRGTLGRRTSVLLTALFGVLMILIIDLDRPASGGIVESQEPMLQLQAFMRASPPGSFDRFNAPAAPAAAPGVG
jgi:hypothetical protein